MDCSNGKNSDQKLKLCSLVFVSVQAGSKLGFSSRLGFSSWLRVSSRLGFSSGVRNRSIVGFAEKVKVTVQMEIGVGEGRS